MSFLILFAWIVGALVIVNVSRKTNTVALTIFSLLYCMPLLNLELVPLDTRGFAAAVLVVKILEPTFRSHYLGRHESMAIFVSLAGFIVLSVASLLWSISPSRTIEGVAGLVLLTLGVYVFANTAEWHDSLLATFRVVSLVCGLSILVVLLDPTVAFEGGRLRGIVENANGLGTLAAFAALIAAGWTRHAQYTVPVFMVIIIASGSRGGMLAAIVGLVLLSMTSERGRASAGVKLFFITYVAAALLVYWYLFRPDLVVLRVDDSRSGVWLDLLPYIASYWPLGSGLATLEIFSTNSFLKAGVELGLLGLVLAVSYLIVLCFVAWGDMRLVGIWAAGLVTALVESWLLAGGSYYSFLFVSIFVFGAESKDRYLAGATSTDKTPS